MRPDFFIKTSKPIKIITMNLDKKVKNRFNISEMLKNLGNRLRILEKGGTGGVQSVTGPGVNNTDTTNPVIKVASTTSEGVVDLVSLQSLGAGDKRINTKRIGTGGGNVSSNTVVGGGLASNTSGANNTSVGSFSLFANTTGSSNTAIGVSAMQSSTTSSGTTAVGHGAGYYSNGAKNTFIGVSSGQGDSVYTGANNTAIGHAVGNKLGSGSNNTLVGSEAGTVTEGITTGSNNTIIGKTATGVTTGSGNTIIGRITGLLSSLINNVILADGAGNIAIKKSTTHELTAPLVTNALITSAGPKALITKEYFDANGAAVPKVYIARFNRQGSNPSTVTVMKNTTGEVFTWSEPFAGNIVIECVNPVFTLAGCFFVIQDDQINTYKQQSYARMSRVSNTMLGIGTVENIDALNTTDVTNIDFLVKIELM